MGKYLVAALLVVFAASSAYAAKIVGNGYTAEECVKAGGTWNTTDTCLMDDASQ